VPDSGLGGLVDTFSVQAHLRATSANSGETWGLSDQRLVKNKTVTTETIDLGQRRLSIVREVGCGLYLNKQNASDEVLSVLE